MTSKNDLLLGEWPGPIQLLREIGRWLGIGRAVLRVKHLKAMTVRGFIEMKVAKRRYLRRIVEARPIPAAQGAIEMHMLLEHRRIYEGIWSLYSFAYFCGQPCRIVVHDDGTLRQSDVHLLKRVFPECEVIPRDKADSVVLEYFNREGLKRCAQLRRTLVLALKLFDPFFFLHNRFFVMMDSDVLFFSRPNELVGGNGDRQQSGDALPENLYFGDVGCSHCVDPKQLADLLGMAPIERLNTGVLRVKRDAIDLRRIETYLQHPGFWTASGAGDYHAEQTLWAMELSLSGAIPLPRTCAICPTVQEADLVCGHFCGAGYGETLFYTRGLPRLARIFLRQSEGSAE